MTKILEFTKFYIIHRIDRATSSQINLEFHVVIIAREQSKESNLIKSQSLRGVSETNDEAISFKA